MDAICQLTQASDLGLDAVYQINQALDLGLDAVYQITRAALWDVFYSFFYSQLLVQRIWPDELQHPSSSAEDMAWAVEEMTSQLSQPQLASRLYLCSITASA